MEFQYIFHFQLEDKVEICYLLFPEGFSDLFLYLGIMNLPTTKRLSKFSFKNRLHKGRGSKTISPLALITVIVFSLNAEKIRQNVSQAAQNQRLFLQLFSDLILTLMTLRRGSLRGWFVVCTPTFNEACINPVFLIFLTRLKKRVKSPQREYDLIVQASKNVYLMRLSL